MQGKGFSVGEVIKLGWHAMRESLGFFVALLISTFVIQFIPALFGQYFLREGQVTLSIVFKVIQFIMGILISIGLVNISLKFADGGKGTFRDLFSRSLVFFQFFVANFFYFIIVLAGLLLLVIPGIIWALKFQLFPYFIVEKGVGPIEALKLSAKATAGAKWDIFAFDVLVTVINIMGILCLGIGLFATAPTLLVASALVYRKLVNQAESEAKPAA